MQHRNPILGYSKAPWGLSVLSRVTGIFTGTTKTIKFDVYVNYATGNSTLNFKSNGIANVLEGMNVILVPDLTTEEAKSNITELVKDAANIDEICLFYSFGKNPEATATEDNNPLTHPSNSINTW